MTIWQIEAESSYMKSWFKPPSRSLAYFAFLCVAYNQENHGDDSTPGSRPGPECHGQAHIQLSKA